MDERNEVMEMQETEETTATDLIPESEDQMDIGEGTAPSVAVVLAAGAAIGIVGKIACDKVIVPAAKKGVSKVKGFINNLKKKDEDDEFIDADFEEVDDDPFEEDPKEETSKEN